MRLVKTQLEFNQLVEAIAGVECKYHSILPDTISGRFFPDRLQELQDFCEKNKGYHIATILDYYTTLNHVVQPARSYMLCYGDNDPNIVLFVESFYLHMKKSENFELIEKKTTAVSKKLIKTLGL